MLKRLALVLLALLPLQVYAQTGPGPVPYRGVNNWPLIFGTDNNWDIGASGATRPRTGYFGTSVITPSLTVSGLTPGRVPFASTGGLLADDADLTFDGTRLSAASMTASAGIITNNAGILLSQNPASAATTDHRITRAGTGLGLYVGTGSGFTTRVAFMGGSTALASATALPVPTGNLHHVTGTTNITSITSTNLGNGPCVGLIFDAGITVTDGSNLKLAGDFTADGDDTLLLCYDGTNWFEFGRSVN